MGRTIPDRWLNYKPIGKQIPGTHFIAFKVPLSENINGSVKNLDTRLDVNTLLREVPNLGLVIDLTQTTKYYNPSIFTQKGIQYIKLQIRGGGKVPEMKYVDEFGRHVEKFLSSDSSKDKLIGVHCTHGVNRTGYLICQHMVRQLNVPPNKAIIEFEHARGHSIERMNYRDGIMHHSKPTEYHQRRRSPEQNWRNSEVRCNEKTSSRNDDRNFQSFRNNRSYRTKQEDNWRKHDDREISSRNSYRSHMNNRPNGIDRRSVMDQVYNDDHCNSSYSWRRQPNTSNNSWRRT